jgi:hypothetical protein
VIVSSEVFEAAQERLKTNQANSTHNLKYEYLLAKRVTCQCGYKMAGQPKSSKGRRYLYYNCPAKGNDRYRKCNIPLFRVERVDTKVWNWVEEVFTNRKNSRKGYEVIKRRRK